MRTPKPSTGGNEAAPNEPWVKTGVRRQRANKEVVMFQTKTVVLGLVSLLVTGIGAAQQPTPAQPVDEEEQMDDALHGPNLRCGGERQARFVPGRRLRLVQP